MLFFLRFENFEVNCLLAFVLGLECEIALVYLISPSNQLLHSLEKNREARKAMKDTVRQLFLFIKLVVIKSFSGSLKWAVHFHWTPI